MRSNLMKLLDEHRVGPEIAGRFHANLTKMTDTHLYNRLKYFERMLANKPSEMVYMGNSEYAEDAVESENAHNEDLAEDIEIHIIDLKEEIIRRKEELCSEQTKKG